MLLHEVPSTPHRVVSERPEAAHLPAQLSSGVLVRTGRLPELVRWPLWPRAAHSTPSVGLGFRACERRGCVDPRALGTCSETFSPRRCPKPALSPEHSPAQQNPWVPGHLLCVSTLLGAGSQMRGSGLRAEG